MRLDQITLKDFRNISQAEVSFSPGKCALVGKNAQGKTNLLEAIYLLACGKSHRSGKMREMIREGKDLFEVAVLVSGEGLPFELKMRFGEKEGRSIFKNGVRLEKLSEFFGLFRVVLFCPEHLSLVQDGPGKRRSFVDSAICQLRPYYVSLLNERNKIEAQRASLLKQRGSKKIPREYFAVWDERLTQVSVKIACIRAQYIKELKEKAPRYFSEISRGKESLSLRYVSDVYREGEDRAEMEEKYLALLRDAFFSDEKYGYTTKGVHRDEIEIYIGEKSARNFASQGQQRSAVLALKFAEGEISREMTGQDPVYLLDDVLSELDGERREYVTRGLTGKQVILSGTDEKDFSFVDKIIRVSGGTFR